MSAGQLDQLGVLYGRCQRSRMANRNERVMRAVQDQIAQWVPGDWTSLGTDGFGLSDTRSALRRHFHVDAASITLAVLTELSRKHSPLDVAARESRNRGVWSGSLDVVTLDPFLTISAQMTIA